MKIFIGLLVSLSFVFGLHAPDKDKTCFIKFEVIKQDVPDQLGGDIHYRMCIDGYSYIQTKIGSIFQEWVYNGGVSRPRTCTCTKHAF